MTVGKGFAASVGAVLDWLRCDYDAVEVDEEMADDVRGWSESAHAARTILRVRPLERREESAMDTTMRLLGGLHDLGVVSSFELWGAEGTEVVVTTPAQFGADVVQLLEAFFAEAEVIERETALPEIAPGDHVAGAELRLENDYCLPIANPLGTDRLTVEPYNEIAQTIHDAPDGTRTVVQAVFEPAPEDWRERWYVPLLPKLSADPDDTIWDRLPLVPRELTCGDIAAQLERNGADQLTVEHVTAEGEQAFTVDLRVIAVAPTPAVASEVTRAIADRFATAYDDADTEQGFRACGVSSRRIRDELQLLATRRPKFRRVRLAKYKREPCVLTVPELAGVAHVPSRTPNDEYALTAPGIDWNPAPGDPSPDWDPDVSERPLRDPE